MSRAILIMDMPENCEDCPLFHRVLGDVYCAKGMGKIPTNGKPDWCPIISETDDEIAWYDQGYMDGWGDCETQYKKWQIGGQQ